MEGSSWNEARDTLLKLVEDELGAVYAWSAKLCTGDRQRWMPQAEIFLEVTEDLLRDVVIRGSGSDLEPINADIPGVITSWTQALWPTGVDNCVRIVSSARANLDANVTGKTALDAFLLYS